VTGGAGFIGANLSRRLRTQGDDVVVVDDLSTGDLDNLRDLDVRYPGFSLSGHKGYGTRTHVAALNALGPSPLHRRSFSPVRVCEDLDDLEALETI